MQTPAVVVMLKAPRPGFVKTRLARDVGAEPAAAIYRCLVEHQMAAIPRDWRIEVHFAPADAAPEMERWLGLAQGYYPQSEGDLGDRLIHATSAAFGRGAGMVIVIGGDCPGLDGACLHEAWHALATGDVVLGPAADGGYYLIGLRRPLPHLFVGIPWSTDAVLRMTLERVHRAGLSPVLLPTKEDVDDLASWRQAQVARPSLAVDAGRPA